MDRPPEPSLDRSGRRSGEKREVFVFVPCDSAGLSPDYDTPEFRVELAEWFSPLGLKWRWVSVTPANIGAAIAKVRDHAAGHAPVVFNLCDGDELDGFPGLSVVEALERAELCFTGADGSFYRMSSSKLAMKKALAHAGLLVPPYAAIGNPADISGVERLCGYPCLVKLDMAAAGMGMHRHSVVHDDVALRARLSEAIAHGNAPRGMLAERFIDGREFTALVVERPDGALAYPTVEIAYHPATPAEERILFQGHRDTPSPHASAHADTEAKHHCAYRVAPLELQERLRSAATAAFAAVGGRGYGRVDLRMDNDGRIYVLEVNANCALSRDEPTIAPAIAAQGQAFHELIATILEEAARRTHSAAS